MKAVTTVLFAALLSGCVHRIVYVPDSRPVDEAEGGYGDDPYYDDAGDYAVEDECEPCWDGHAWIEITIPHHFHGPGCGHFFHHGCWHLYPAGHVYLEFGWACFGETGGFYSHGDPCARVWDGCEFTVIRHHVCGPGCGHFFHHGCWNTCREDHVWSDSRHFHFADHAPVFHPGHAEGHHEASRGPRELKGDEHPRKPSREASRAPATRDGRGSKVEERKRPAAPSERVEPPKRRDPQPEREKIEQPGRQDPPPQREKIEPPRRKDPPPDREKLEQPRRQDPPPQREKIEPPRRKDPPPDREKLEQPRRQDPPPQREKIELPRRKDPQPDREKVEQPRRQDPPPQREKTEQPRRKDPQRKRKAATSP